MYAWRNVYVQIIYKQKAPHILCCVLSSNWVENEWVVDYDATRQIQSEEIIQLPHNTSSQTRPKNIAKRKRAIHQIREESFLKVNLCAWKASRVSLSIADTRSVAEKKISYKTIQVVNQNDTLVPASRPSADAARMELSVFLFVAWKPVISNWIAFLAGKMKLSL